MIHDTNTVSFTEDAPKGIVFTVRGVPHPQPRPRVHNGIAVSTTGKHVKLWKSQVQIASINAKTNIGGKEEVEKILGTKGPLFLEILFYLPTDFIDRWGKFHSQVCDLDNLIKLVQDTVIVQEGQNGLIESNDARVSVYRASKSWCSPERAGCLVGLSRLE